MSTDREHDQDADTSQGPSTGSLRMGGLRTSSTRTASAGTRLTPHPAAGSGTPRHRGQDARAGSPAWAARPAARLLASYDYVVADDPTIWPDENGSSTQGLLDLPRGAQVAALGALAAGGRRLIVICNPAQVQPVRALAAAARGLHRARIAIMPIEHGPAMQSAAALIGQVLLTSGMNRPVTEVIERLPGLTNRLTHVVLMRSVSKVNHPAITIRDHARSYLPGRRLFAVQSAPEPGLVRLDHQGRVRPEAGRLTAPLLDPPLGLTVHVLGPRPVPSALLACCGLPTDAPAAMPTALSPARHWPDADATEIVALPQDIVGWVAGQLPGVEAWPCRWCDEPLAAPVRSCPFCADTLPS